MKCINPNPGDSQNTDSFAANDPQPPTTVAIVDDDKNDRHLIVQALNDSGKFVCVGAYSSANEALAEIPKVCPQVVLMDIRMPGMSGIVCAHRLRKLLPELVVIFVTGLLDDTSLSESVQAGGDDYLVKPLSVSQCMASIITALGRRRRNNAHAKTGSAHGLPLLTERERAVLDGLATGLLYKEIAEKLHTTQAIVHKLQHSIYSKLQVGNRSEAIGVFFRQQGQC